jgi:hypothetical protein
MSSRNARPATTKQSRSRSKSSRPRRGTAGDSALPVKSTPAWKAFTVRVDSTLGKRFDEMKRGRKPAEVSQELVKLWIEKEKHSAGGGGELEVRESLTDTLVFAVLHQLRTNPGWANDALQAAHLLDPFMRIYTQRAGHFRDEKLALAKRFTPWFVRRALHYAKTHDVRIAIDAGTTLKDPLDEIGPAFVAFASHDLEPGQVQIVTNNFPGAESYEAYASTTKFGDRFLGDVVPCRLVPGQALREYSAVVGRDAEEYLIGVCAQTKGQRPCIRLGLVASNWVLLEGQAFRPTLMARGDMHREFKEVVLNTCDESFLISPLCKMVQANPNKDEAGALSEFNLDFAEIDRPDKGAYQRVQPADGFDSTRLRVVTTTRTVNKSIVYPHATIICGLLRATARASYDVDIDKPFEEIPHLVYVYDDHATDSFDDQLTIELPHARTRAKEFRAKYFHIGS